MNTLFLSSSWKVVVQELLLSLLSFRGPYANGNPESRNKIKSFSNKQTGSRIRVRDDNYNDRSRNPAGRTLAGSQILRDNGQRCIVSCCRFVGLRHYKNSVLPLIKRVRPICRLQGAGFTLIELLVVVLIIGILAAAALPSYRVAVGTSRVATMYAFMRAVDQAQQHFYMQTNRYASNFDSLVVAIPAGFKKYSSTQVGNSDMFCDLRDTDSNGNPNNSVVCMEKKNHISLVKFYIYESASCWAPSLDVGDIPNRICQNLSGRDSPSGSDSGKTGYNYSFR